MKNLFTYPSDSGTYYINSTHIGDGTYGMSYRVDELIQGNYLAWNGLDALSDLSQTWQTLTPELSKYIEYFDDNKLLTNLSQYDFYHLPLVVVDTAVNTWTVDDTDSNYNEFGATGNSATFYTDTPHALWNQIQLEMTGLTGDWSSLNSTKLYGQRTGGEGFKLHWDSSLTDPVDFYWQKKETGVTTTVTAGNPIVFNQTGHDLIESMPVNASSFDGTMSYLQQNDLGTPYTYYVKIVDADSFKLTTDAAGTIELTPDLGPQDVNISSFELTSGNDLEITLPSGTDNVPDGSRVRELNGLDLNAEEFSFPDKTYDFPQEGAQIANGTTRTLPGGKHTFSKYGDRMLLTELKQRSQTTGYDVWITVYEYDHDNNEWDYLDSVNTGWITILSLEMATVNRPFAISGDGNVIVIVLHDTTTYVYEFNNTTNEYDLKDTLTLTYPNRWDLTGDIAISETGDRFILKETISTGQTQNIRVYSRSGDDWTVEQTLYSLDYHMHTFSYYGWETFSMDDAGEQIILKHILPVNDTLNDVGNSLTTTGITKQFALWSRSGTTWTNQNLSLYPNWSIAKVIVSSGNASLDLTTEYTGQSLNYVNDINQHMRRCETSIGGGHWVAFAIGNVDINSSGDGIAFGGNAVRDTNAINTWTYDTSWTSHRNYEDSALGDNWRIMENDSAGNVNLLVEGTTDIWHKNVASTTEYTISTYTKESLSYPVLGPNLSGVARGYHYPDLGVKANGKIFKLDFGQNIFNQMVSAFNAAGDLWLKTTATDDVYEVYLNSALTTPFGWQSRSILTTAGGGAGQGSYDNDGHDMDISIGYPSEDSTTGTITEVYDRDADGNTIALFTEPVDFTGSATVAPHADEQHPRYADSVTIHLGGDKQFSRLDANGDPETSINWTQWYEPGNEDPESASVRPLAGTAFDTTVNHTVDANYRIATSTLGAMNQRGAYKTDETEFCLNLYSEADLYTATSVDDGTQWTDFGDDSRKEWPNEIAPSVVNIVYNMPASTTVSASGTKYALPSGRYKWAIEAEYPPLTEDQFRKMQLVANAVSGVANPFYFRFSTNNTKWLWDNNTSSTDFIRFRKQEIDNNDDTTIEAGLKTFLVDGFEGDEVNAFNQGEVIDIEPNINGGLNTVVNQVDANVFGEARITIASPLEFDHENGELINKDPVKCVVTLADNDFVYTKRTDGFYELKVTFNLDKFED